MKKSYQYFLIKPASSLCNLRCKYCFYSNVSNLRDVKSYGIMDDKTMVNLIDYAFNTSTDDATIIFAFQGGEPTLAKVSYYEHFISYVNQKVTKQKINYYIQTNAYKIDEEYFKLFKDNHFLVGVSLDAYKENNDYFRVNTNHDSSFKYIMKTIDRLKKENIEFNVVSVLTEKLASNPNKYYNFIKENNFLYVQLIPCLPPLDSSPNYGISAKSFATFHKKLFDLWYQDFIIGKYYSINTFDNYINMFKGNFNTICGITGVCTPQNVVEANGNLYPCDFYTLDSLLLTNLNNALNDEIDYTKFLNYDDKRVKPHCYECRFFKLCNGGCKRMSSIYHYKDYCGLEDFLEYTYERMLKIIERID